MFGKEKCFQFYYCATATTVNLDGGLRTGAAQPRDNCSDATSWELVCSRVLHGAGECPQDPILVLPKSVRCRGQAALQVLPPAAPGGRIHIPVGAAIPRAQRASQAPLRFIKSHSHSFLCSVCLFIYNLSI